MTQLCPNNWDLADAFISTFPDLKLTLSFYFQVSCFICPSCLSFTVQDLMICMSDFRAWVTCFSCFSSAWFGINCFLSHISLRAATNAASVRRNKSENKVQMASMWCHLFIFHCWCVWHLLVDVVSDRDENVCLTTNSMVCSCPLFLNDSFKKITDSLFCCYWHFLIFKFPCWSLGILKWTKCSFLTCSCMYVCV